MPSAVLAAMGMVVLVIGLLLPHVVGAYSEALMQALVFRFTCM